MRHISHILAEVYPGASKLIEQMVADAGGWVCEQHPDLPWPHDDCPGPGMVAADLTSPVGTEPSSTLTGEVSS